MSKESVDIERRTITVSEAARILGISRGAAYAAVHRGEIPSIRLGRRYVVPIDRLDELLDGRSTSNKITKETF